MANERQAAMTEHGNAQTVAAAKAAYAIARHDVMRFRQSGDVADAIASGDEVIAALDRDLAAARAALEAVMEHAGFHYDEFYGYAVCDYCHRDVHTEDCVAELARHVLEAAPDAAADDTAGGRTP